MKQAEFLGNKVLQSAVLHQLTIIGEAAACIPAAIRQKYPHVPWSRIVRFRNVVVHAYFTLDLNIIWETATVHAPALRQDVEAILTAEDPNPGQSRPAP